MSGASIIWVSSDLSEQIADFNGEYVLITVSDMKRTALGKSLEDAIEKLKEIGRDDIVKHLR